MNVPREPDGRETQLNKKQKSTKKTKIRYRLFRCPRCRTELYVSQAEVGTEVVCPDCDTSVVVPDYLDFSETDEERREAARFDEEKLRRDALYSPTKNPNRDGIELAGENSYSLDDGTYSESKKATLDATFPVYCRVCNALLYATREELGSSISCPDCGTETVATTALRDQLDAAAKISVPFVRGTSPELKIKTPSSFDVGVYRRLLGRPRLRANRKNLAKPDDFLPLVLRRRGDNFVWVLASPPKKYPMFNRVFRALATAELWARGGLVAIFLGAIAAYMTAFMLPSLALYSQDAFGRAPGEEILFLFASLLATPTAVACGSVFATFFASIFNAGNCGARRVVDWRTEDILGSIAFESWLFLIVAAALAPGFLGAALLNWGSGEEIYVVWQSASGTSWLGATLQAGSFWLVFPIFFLSTMQKDSFFWPLSDAVFSSFWKRGRAWLQFYAASAVATIPGVLFFRFIGNGLAWTILPFAAPLFCALYALLLGRLSWILDDDLRNAEYDD